jgi:Mg2+ and Co2+ transporter CorA
VAEKKVSEMTQMLNQLWYETGQAVVQSTFDVQSRSIQYVQNSLMDGMETLKSHIDASQHLVQRENKPPDQQETIPSLMESGVEAYKRNINLLERITEHGTETFRTNAETVRDLTQTLMKKTQDQQNMLF